MKGMMSVMVMGAMLVAGCETLDKMAEAGRKQREAQIAQAHLEDNVGAECSGTIESFALHAERVMRRRGYVVNVKRDGKGYGRAGYLLECRKTDDRDLGSTVASNVIGNMLGADRGNIIQSRTEQMNVVIRKKWAPDGINEQRRVLMVEAGGGTYETNQKNEKVNLGSASLSDIAELKDTLIKGYQKP